MIEEVDKARERYSKRYTKLLPNDTTYKHIMIDSNMLGIHGTAEYLSDLIRRRFSL